ncbi:hypothetical protein ACIQVU_00510 [Lysinibacillus sp. NPDC098008]|uniref:hypothetical protein n=1 Tax=Lysinibacillus sp. NPDC098008 TaxID=3364146 RepID=UPI00381FC7E6
MIFQLITIPFLSIFRILLKKYERYRNAKNSRDEFEKNRFIILILVVFVSLGFIYYLNMDRNYKNLEELQEFPIPNSVILEEESSTAKNYSWKSSSGTSIPISYRMVIKKNGWKQVEIDGHGITYEKDGYKINITVASDYKALIRVQ